MPTKKQLTYWERMKGHPQYNTGRTHFKKGIYQWEGKDHPRGMLGKTAWNKGISHSEETKRKIGLANFGRKLSEEHKRKISESNKGSNHYMFGKQHSEETKKKIGLAHRGKELSGEHRERLYEGLLKRWAGNKTIWTEEYKKNNLKRWRHMKGISKRYNDEEPSGISYTKEYKKLQRQKRKAFMKGGGKLSIKTIQQVYEDNIKKYGTLTCYLCEKPVEFKKDHLEHKTPLSRGGTNLYENLGVSCQKCNCKKHTKTEQEFRKEILSL